MKTSFMGAYSILAHEGLVPGPYMDSVKVWTFGAGHTAAAGKPNPANMPRGMPNDLDAAIENAISLFFHDLIRYETSVNSALRTEVSQHEFDALVSFHYNTGAIARADLVKHLNKGDRDKAAAGFMNWRKPTEVIPRRAAEQALFRDGVYPAKGVPVWRVDNAGNVIWRKVKTLTPEDVRRMMRPAPDEIIRKPESSAFGLVAAGIAAAIAAAFAAFGDAIHRVTDFLGG